MSDQTAYNLVKFVFAIGSFIYTLYQGTITWFDTKVKNMVAEDQELTGEDQELTEEKARNPQLRDIVFTHKAVWACKAFRGQAINVASNVVLGDDADHHALIVRGRQGNSYCYFVAQFGGNGWSTGTSKLDLRIVLSSIKNAALAICKNPDMSRVWVKNMSTRPPSNGQVILEDVNGNSYLGTWISLGRQYSLEELFNIASSVDRVRRDYNVTTNNCWHYVDDVYPLVE